MNMYECRFCGSREVEVINNYGGDVYTLKCPDCGEVYRAIFSAIQDSRECEQME